MRGKIWKGSGLWCMCENRFTHWLTERMTLWHGLACSLRAESERAAAVRKSKREYKLCVDVCKCVCVCVYVHARACTWAYICQGLIVVQVWGTAERAHIWHRGTSMVTGNLTTQPVLWWQVSVCAVRRERERGSGGKESVRKKEWS